MDGFELLLLSSFGTYESPKTQAVQCLLKPGAGRRREVEAQPRSVLLPGHETLRANVLLLSLDSIHKPRLIIDYLCVLAIRVFDSGKLKIEWPAQVASGILIDLHAFAQIAPKFFFRKRSLAIDDLRRRVQSFGF